MVWGEWMPAIVATIAAVLAGVFAIINRTGAEKSKARNMNPPDWPEAWERIDLLERQLRAAVRLLVDTINQWPVDAEPPNLHTKDIEILQDTLPTKLRNRTVRND